LHIVRALSLPPSDPGNTLLARQLKQLEDKPSVIFSIFVFYFLIQKSSLCLLEIDVDLVVIVEVDIIFCKSLFFTNAFIDDVYQNELYNLVLDT
jgi:hypothetical protein